MPWTSFVRCQNGYGFTVSGLGLNCEIFHRKHLTRTSRKQLHVCSAGTIAPNSHRDLDLCIRMWRRRKTYYKKFNRASTQICVSTNCSVSRPHNQRKGKKRQDSVNCCFHFTCLKSLTSHSALTILDQISFSEAPLSTLS